MAWESEGLPQCNRPSVPLNTLSLPLEVSIGTAEELKSSAFMAGVLFSGESVLFGCHDLSKPNWLQPFSLILAGLQEDMQKEQIRYRR